MKRLMRWLAYVLAVLVVLALGLKLWMGSLARENDRVRPSTGPYQIEGGAAFGGPVPRADGYVQNSAGFASYLPVLQPEREMNVHHAEVDRRDSQIKSCFWPSGGRTRSGYLSTDTNSAAIDNQLPDVGTTFQITFFKIPAGGRIVLKGEYPHMRHWSFVTYGLNGEPRDGLADRDIEPDAGSQNPFRTGVRRDVAQRRYTLSIVNGKPPQERPRNTLYTLDEDGKDVGMLMRNYVPDGSRDLYGGVALPVMELQQADGSVLSGDAACAATDAPLRGKQVPTAVSPTVWVALTHMFSSDSSTAPAKPFEVQPLEMFFNRFHLLARLFLPSLPTHKLAEQKGGFWSNADTRYGYRFINQQHGKVYALRGKLPTTPKTWHGDGGPLAQADMTYWSVCTAMGMSSGMTVDCVYDEMLEPTLDAQRRYAIVVSRAVDRPSNATEKCGVTWMEWGNGDGIVGGTPDHGLIINRNTEPSRDFKHSWFSVKQEGAEREAMGEYLPQLVNFHEKQQFEALGCPIDASKIDARIAAGR